jgi:hypothetical protein
MDWPTALVAVGASLTAAVATGTVAIRTIRSQAANADKDRQHARAMAQEARRHDHRAAAYIELLTALNHLLDRVNRTSPILETNPPHEPPPPVSDDDLWRLNALTAAFASPDLQDMVREWSQVQSDFYAAVWYLHQVQQHQDRRPATDTKAKFGVDEVDQWRKVEAIRQDLRDRIDAIGKQVNSELEGGLNGNVSRLRHESRSGAGGDALP